MYDKTDFSIFCNHTHLFNPGKCQKIICIHQILVRKRNQIIFSDHCFRIICVSPDLRQPLQAFVRIIARHSKHCQKQRIMPQLIINFKLLSGITVQFPELVQQYINAVKIFMIPPKLFGWELSSKIWIFHSVKGVVLIHEQKSKFTAK